MKKYITSAVLFIVTASALQAQHVTAAKVPAPVKTAFEKKYAGSSAQWEKEDGNYEASFKQNGIKMSATFTPDGTFTESETTIPVKELPAAATTYVKELYKGKAIKEASIITKADGTINYEAEVNGKDVLFDAGGIFIKAMKD